MAQIMPTRLTVPVSLIVLVVVRIALQACRQSPASQHKSWKVAQDSQTNVQHTEGQDRSERYIRCNARGRRQGRRHRACGLLAPTQRAHFLEWCLSTHVQQRRHHRLDEFDLLEMQVKVGYTKPNTVPMLRNGNVPTSAKTPIRVGLAGVVPGLGSVCNQPHLACDGFSAERCEEARACMRLAEGQHQRHLEGSDVGERSRGAADPVIVPAQARQRQHCLTGR